MKRSDKAAWKESLSDTAIGTAVNFPLNMMILTVTFALEFTVFWTAFVSWFIFTIVAILRKFLVRKYFAKKQKEVENDG
jgi:ABC-type protease/lipase transport system fused ATPase/permease subunit